jgi:hypothetical protein
MRAKWFCLLLLAFSFLSHSISAQVNTASVGGMVSDPSHAIVPNVVVTATSRATGVVRNTKTDSSGYYSFPSLPIGDYDLQIEQSGFATASKSITLQSAQKSRLDFELVVGQVSDKVEVTAEAQLLSPDDASLGSVVENMTISETPLYLRNWDDLLRLVPGVQANRYTDQSGATSAGRTGGFNVHGVHSLQNNFILDGVDNNSISENVQELTSQASRPSVDAIQEFKVITNPYSSEYGRSPGAAVSVNTKGGTNAFHGLAYEYLRNRIFDANDWFSNHNGLKKPQNVQNQFGGDFGGPIVKDKLFAYFNYEGTRIRRGVSRLTTVPLPNERIGDFSPAAATAAGTTYPTIYDPLTGNPFPNNQIPQGRIDPYMAKIMALFPLPNLPGAVNNFTRNAGLLDDNDNYTGRVDWSPGGRDTLFARYTYSNRTRQIPGNFGGIADGTTTSAWGNQSLAAHNAALGWTHTFSSTLTNEFRLGFSRNVSVAAQQAFGLNHTADYVPGVPVNPAVDGGVSNTSFAGFNTQIGSPDFLPKSQIPTQYEWVDSLSYLHGKHNLKFGADIHWPMRNIFQDEPGTRGSLGFDKTFTCLRSTSGTCTGNTGLSYADALLGYVKSSQLSNVFFADQRLYMLSGYVQDDYKILPKLTLNLGLRYDFASPALEGANRMANFNPAGTGSLVFGADGSLEQRALVQPARNNWAPRIGLAYSFDAKTVLRAGYGIYYALFERYGSEDQLALNPLGLVNNVATVSSTSTVPVFILKNGFPANSLDPNSLFKNGTDYTKVRIRAVDPNIKTPSVQQWSAGIQRELPGQFVGQLDYVGTHSTHLNVLTDYNQPIPNFGSSNGVVTSFTTPYSQFGYIEYMSGAGHGSYNGLEASLLRHFRNGFNFRAVYTYSRSYDNTPEELSSNSGAAPDGRNLGAWWGRSDFDTPHRLNVSYLYELPFGHNKGIANSGIAAAILGGFRTSGVYTFASGRPFTVNSGSSRKNAVDPFGATTAVPYMIAPVTIVGNANCWYYASQNKFCQSLAPSATNAFRLQNNAVGEYFGDETRNSLRGPHTNVFDFALLREIRMMERANLEFRWEIFNLFNTPQFGQPNTDFSSSSAGQITSLAGDPRVMQFALRFSF